jgi:hypothetical protein
MQRGWDILGTPAQRVLACFVLGCHRLFSDKQNRGVMHCILDVRMSCKFKDNKIIHVWIRGFQDTNGCELV